MIATAPLRARNRLAATVLAALGDLEARRRLDQLAADRVALEAWVTADDRASIDRLWHRARAAAGAVRALPLADPAHSLATALAAAAVLFDAGLGFEVHEVLEPHWASATGDRRGALQGLIQVAVGFQHLANGNVEGARALIGEGAARLRGRSIDGLALGDFARDASAVIGRLGAEPLLPPRFPR